MSKNTPFLDLHKKWGRNKRTMPEDGLCKSLGQTLSYSKAFYMVSPTINDIFHLYKSDLPRDYWGQLKHNIDPKKYTALRQTIMLLAAALNGEFD